MVIVTKIGRHLPVPFVLLLATACSSDPANLIPPGERVLLQQEAANERAAKPVSVDDMLARARSQNKALAAPLVLHITDDKGILQLAPADLAELAHIPPEMHDAVLSVGPGEGQSPLAAALGANRRAKFIVEKLPATLHLGEMRYDINLTPDTARLDFGGAGLAR